MINNIDYSNWKNSDCQKLAIKVDRDGVKGLSSQEMFEFTKLALNNNIKRTEISELLGAKFSKPASKIQWHQEPKFNEARKFYNDKMDYSKRSDVTYKTYSNLETRLYNMEKAVDEAFIKCEAYQDIVIIPQKYYKFYPHFNDRLINFDIEEIRNLTSKDMDSLYELRENIEYIMEEANGIEEHKKPERREYDIEMLAQKHLGMSYEEFSLKYQEELEYCKSVTTTDLSSMTETQRMVYSKAKAYVLDMLNTTIMEAHNTNWDAGKRKTEEILKATDDMFIISEFETEGITDNGLEELKSGIMYKAFEEELIKLYEEINSNAIEELQIDSEYSQPQKVIVNGALLIFMPDGSIYDTSGKKIK